MSELTDMNNHLFSSSSAHHITCKPTGLDTCDKSLYLSECINLTFWNEYVWMRARCVLEYVQLFLSQCNELNGRKIGAGDEFEAYLKTLNQNDCVEWDEFIERLDPAIFENDQDLRKFSTLITEKLYTTLEPNIHNFCLDNVCMFLSALQTTTHETLLHNFDQWKSMAEFLSQPDRFKASAKQKKRLSEMKLLL